jgi:hypothetical protein
MPIFPTRPDEESPRKGFDETTEVVRDFQRNLNRVLGFLGYTIDDVVNDPRRKEHVKRAYQIARRIDRDLEEETWYTEATERLAEFLARRLAVPGSRPGAAPRGED